MSVIVTAIKDPFRPEENHKTFYDFEEGKPLSYYLQHLDLTQEDVTFTCAVNGDPVDLNVASFFIVPYDGTRIAVACRVEALTVATLVTNSLFSSFAAGLTLAANAVFVGTYLATTFAIGYGLSLIASALAPDPPNLADSRGAASAEQTYGWGTLRQTEQEGTRIAYLFGTNKVSGHVLNQYISVENNNETLNMLLGICDHEVDSITDIRLNNQSYTNFRDTEVFTRLGTFNDTVIPGFGELVTQTTVNSKLVKDVGIVVRTGGDQVEKLRVFITAPNGIYYTDASGNVILTEASFDIEYRLVGAGAWTTFSSEQYFKATTSAQRFTYDIDSLPPGRYEVQVTRKNEEITDLRGRNTLYFSLVQEIIKDELIYPGLSKYAIKALATEQLSGSTPSFTCLATRNNVSVYNEDTGYWEDKRATSPPWIVYALLNEFAGIPESKIIWDDFEEWADYCDELIDGEYRFIVNTVIYDSNFWTEIQRVAKLGRATIIRRGTRYGVFVDKEATDVVDMFGMGNIIDNTLNIQYLPKKDRANAVEIEYTDPDRDYTRQVITIYDESYLDNSSDPQKSNVSFQSTIPQAQAIREGVYRINSNRFLNEVITFDAFVDSFAATVGDLIYFQHIIPDYNTVISGRIIDAGNPANPTIDVRTGVVDSWPDWDYESTGTFVQIDQEFTIETDKNYSIVVRLRDGTLVERLINNAPGTTDTFTLTSAWSTVPTVILGQEQPTYQLGDVTLNKSIYRLTGCTRKDDFVRTLTAVEYVSDIYTNNDNFIIEEIEDTDITQRAIGVQLFENVIFDAFGSYVSTVGVSWDTIQSGGFQWEVWLEDITASTIPIKVLTTGSTTGEIPSVFINKTHQYRVYVNKLGEGAVSYFSNVGTITIEGKNILPDDIISFFIQNNQLVWQYPGITGEIAGFKLKSGVGANVSWTYADFLNNGEFVTSPYSIAPQGTTVTYLLKAYDYEGRESENPAKIIINLGDILVQNIVEETIISPPFDGDITNGTVIGDELYSDNNGNFWQGISTNNIWKGAAGEPFFDSQYLEMTYIDTFTPTYEGIPVIIEVDATAPTGLLLFYREKQTTELWSGNTVAEFWSGVPTASFWEGDGMSDFRLLPNPVNLTLQPYELKLVTNSGAGQSILREIQISYDFPDIGESLENIVIGSSGTRLPITKNYQVIKNVSLTLQDTGSTAVSLEIVDKDATVGPLIKAYDVSKSTTTATIDARIQGY